MRRAGPLAAALVLAAGCTGSDGGQSGRITVGAASSLTEAFAELEPLFEADPPDTDLEVSFDASSGLATQVLEGAPLDVFVSADDDQMARVVAAGRAAGAPVPIARNDLVVVTRPGNPSGIDDLADLADLPDGDVVALCVAEAPCGRLAADALGAAGVSIPEDRVTRGQNVKATLAAVSEGDALAGIVYVTDARVAAGRVEVVGPPLRPGGGAVYLAVALADAGDPATAAAFVHFLTAPDAQAVLGAYGFRSP